MALTLKDVATAAGVSRSTASRALSGSPLITPSTRLKVEDAAASLGYRPNRAARALRSKRSHLIGLVLNNLVNTSFHTIAEVVQRRAAEEGYQVILCITDADAKTERSFLDMLADHGVDGVIIIGSGENASTLNGLYADGTAVVNLIRSPAGTAAPAVLAGDIDGAYQATKYLLDLGHKSIAFIGGPTGTNSGEERYRGYKLAIREVGFEPDIRLVRRGPFDADFGAKATIDLLGTRPQMTALFAANHEAVFGVLPTLVGEQVRIPGDLSLVCYEDIFWLKWWQPPITVVDNGAYELGALAVDILLRQMSGESRRRNRDDHGSKGESGRMYRVGAQMIHRASCKTLQ